MLFFKAEVYAALVEMLFYIIMMIIVRRMCF